MKDALVKTARFIVNLLGQPAGDVVQIGRRNFRRDDFNGLQIVIDSIGASTRTSFSKDYDGENEQMTYSSSILTPVTVNFYGDSASFEATRFILLANSQKGYENQRDLGVAIYGVSAINDLKFLTGDQYSERLELEFNVRTIQSLTEEIKRIDTPIFSVISSK